MASQASVWDKKHPVVPGNSPGAIAGRNIEHFKYSSDQIAAIRVVVHSTGAEPNGWSDNHVSVYLVLRGNSNTIRVNMRTDDDDTITGTLWWTQEGYQVSNSSIIYWDYPLLTDMTVGTLYSWVIHWGLHRYLFSGGGSGCRHWTYKLIGQLAGIGCLHVSVPANVLSRLGFQYSKSEDWEPQPIQINEGEFITDADWRAPWFDD